VKLLEDTNRTGVRRWRRGIAAVSLVLAVGTATGTAIGTAASGGSAAAPPMTIRPTTAELQQWQRLTATPFERAVIVDKVRDAFAGVAQVGIGPMPTDTRPTTRSVMTEGVTHNIQLVLAVGITGDHFWITASYADVARGAITGAVYACESRGVPAWLCQSAGALLRAWANGWGYANNHGVWAAVYWWPPHVTGGRW